GRTSISSEDWGSPADRARSFRTEGSLSGWTRRKCDRSNRMRANGYIMVMLRPLRVGLAAAAVLASAAVACGGGAVDTDTGAGGSPTGVGGTASGGAGSGVGGTGTGGGEVITLPGGLELEGSPQYYRVVRLTHVQWENSVREV